MDDPMAMIDLMTMIIVGYAFFAYCILLIVGEDENN